MSLWAVQYGFTGYIADQETGLLHARWRMYSSPLGRFIGRDLDYIDGINRYAAYFVPSGVDPYGLWTYEITRNVEVKHDNIESLGLVNPNEATAQIQGVCAIEDCCINKKKNIWGKHVFRDKATGTINMIVHVNDARHADQPPIDCSTGDYARPGARPDNLAPTNIANTEAHEREHVDQMARIIEAAIKTVPDYDSGCKRGLGDGHVAKCSEQFTRELNKAFVRGRSAANRESSRQNDLPRRPGMPPGWDSPWERAARAAQCRNAGVAPTGNWVPR